MRTVRVRSRSVDGPVRKLSQGDRSRSRRCHIKTCRPPFFHIGARIVAQPHQIRRLLRSVRHRCARIGLPPGCRVRRKIRHGLGGHPRVVRDQPPVQEATRLFHSRTRHRRRCHAITRTPHHLPGPALRHNREACRLLLTPDSAAAPTGFSSDRSSGRAVRTTPCPEGRNRPARSVVVLSGSLTGSRCGSISPHLTRPVHVSAHGHRKPALEQPGSVRRLARTDPEG